MKTENKILELTFDFSLKIIGLYKVLLENKRIRNLQAIAQMRVKRGANVEEANAAQTKKDFITKMSVASKEARETKYWLRLLEKNQIVQLDYSTYLNSIEHIINILTKIVKTSQEMLSIKKTKS